MRLLVLLHRWLGVGFCLLFAMWFASGIVMHFVPFPELTDQERFAGRMPIDLSLVLHGPEEAFDASGMKEVRRIRLIQRIDGPIYIISGASKPAAFHAADLSDASVKSAQLALQVAKANAHQRGLDATGATAAELVNYDQCTVSNVFDGHRPFYRAPLNDPAGTELYVSTSTGEIVLETTRDERVWNYLGSVAHWIYPTILRSKPVAWDKAVWTLSFIALFAAATGAALGISRLRVSRTGIGSPFQGWHAWHHVLGLMTVTFTLTWIFSGWLSMDNGRLFSRGELSGEEAAQIPRTLDWDRLAGSLRSISASAKVVEWFALDDRLYKRERTGLDSQSISAIDPASETSSPVRPFLTAAEVDAFVRRFAAGCAAPFVVGVRDEYPIAATIPGAPVYRSICGSVWFHIDGANGAVLERLDASRRRYRWLYTALHTLNFPILYAHPMVRSVLIVVLCAIGFIFSMTGVVIGWRTLRLHFPPQRQDTKSQATKSQVRKSKAYP